MSMDTKRLLTLLGITALTLGACIPAPFTPPTQVQGDPASTALAQTFDAFQTESAQTLAVVEQTRQAVTETALLATPSPGSETVSSTPDLAETSTALTDAFTETPTATGSLSATSTGTPASTGTPSPTSSGATG